MTRQGSMSNDRWVFANCCGAVGVLDGTGTVRAKDGRACTSQLQRVHKGNVQLERVSRKKSKTGGKPTARWQCCGQVAVPAWVAAWDSQPPYVVQPEPVSCTDHEHKRGPAPELVGRELQQIQALLGDRAMDMYLAILACKNHLTVEQADGVRQEILTREFLGQGGGPSLGEATEAKAGELLVQPTVFGELTQLLEGVLERVQLPGTTDNLKTMIEEKIFQKAARRRRAAGPDSAPTV